VIGDYREPEVMRFGITPLYLSFVDIWQAVQHIKAVFANKEWDKPAYKTRSKVT
jgi:kynureninase